MLRKSLFSPAQPRRAETHLFPCGVLASFRPSTYPDGTVLGPSLAAALLVGLFEHPAGMFCSCPRSVCPRNSLGWMVFP